MRADDVLAWIDECIAYDDQGPALSRRTAGQLARWAQSQLDAAPPTPAGDEPVCGCGHPSADHWDGPGGGCHTRVDVERWCSCRVSHSAIAGRAGVSPQPEITRPDFDAIQAVVAEPLLRWTDDMHPKTVPELVTEIANAVWALLADGATPAGPATCESCGQPATVTLPDRSTWCEGCDETARRFGYDVGATPAEDDQ